MHFNSSKVVRVVYQGRETWAEVLLESEDTLSLFLVLDCGALPVIWDGSQYVDLFLGEPVVILLPYLHVFTGRPETALRPIDSPKPARPASATGVSGRFP